MLLPKRLLPVEEGPQKGWGLTRPDALQGELDQARIRTRPVPLGASLAGDLGFDDMPLVGLFVAEQAAQVFQLEAGGHAGCLKQHIEPGEVVGPAVGVHRAAGQLGIEQLGYIAGTQAALLEQLAGDAVQAGGTGVPVGPVGLGLHQGAIGMAVREHIADLDGVTIAPQAGRLDIQDRGRCEVGLAVNGQGGWHKCRGAWFDSPASFAPAL